ncbi:tetratricopeptide repeat protein, partial [Actinomadura rifamycini]|uniref:tetratricopeptide repeat protein n=1 Tax=Actinomadura rifamycini TaxID=31962 RepID=UPI00047B36CA
MTSRVDVLSSRIEEVFTSGVPPWLLFFTRDSQAALDALFKMTYYHGRLNTMDPDLLLINWASAVKAPEFHAELDRALSDWITAEWEHRGPTTGVTDATWQYALRTIASLEQAPVATLAALRSRFEEAPGRIGMMTRNRAHDPIGWYWAALSRAQTDDWLVPHWFRLCNLVPGTPLFHGRWGLLGLRRAPNPSGDGPPAIAVSGLREFLSALNAQVEQHHIRAGGARMLAITECQAVLRANPTNAWRREMWAHLADLTAPAADWLPSVLGPRPAHIARTPNRVVPRADWAARAKDISGQLATQGSRALQPALRLLDEQREYNAKTGATYNLVRSLCVFSHTIVTRQPGQAMLAVRWADEARALEPWNAYTWTISSRARVAAGDDDMAISIAYESLDRFPEDVIVRCSLAEVLKAAGRLDESESVYRETQARFPGEPNVRNGLAEALKAAGRLDEAESVYRETLTRFPDEIKARNGLAEVLKAVHRLDEAEAMYRETVARFPRNEFA